MKLLSTMADVDAIDLGEDRKLFSATHEEILTGATTDIYFVKTQEILEKMGKGEEEVVAEIFCREPGVFCGSEEAKGLLRDRNLEVWSLPEGAHMEPKEVVMRIRGKYKDFGVLETAILGILASSSGWATAAKRIADAAGDKTVAVFGARHVHPAVAPVMERAALIGGISASSCIIGAKLMGKQPSGTTPHALFLSVGETLKAALAYDEYMPEKESRLFLVDTFKDEVEEALILSNALGEKLYGVRLDTPSERGGVTPGLVKELRARLDMNGFPYVKIFASGGITPERLQVLAEAGADAFGIGSYISGASAIDMTMDLKEVDGKPVAKRGRIPGLLDGSRLERLL